MKKQQLEDLNAMTTVFGCIALIGVRAQKQQVPTDSSTGKFLSEFEKKLMDLMDFTNNHKFEASESPKITIIKRLNKFEKTFKFSQEEHGNRTRLKSIMERLYTIPAKLTSLFYTAKQAANDLKVLHADLTIYIKDCGIDTAVTDKLRTLQTELSTVTKEIESCILIAESKS